MTVKTAALYGFGGGALGILFAMILYEMNSRSLLINEFITGDITIEVLMSVVVLLFTLVGAVLGMTRR